MIELTVISPFLGISYFSFFFLADSIGFGQFLSSNYRFFWISYSSFSFLVLKITSHSNSKLPISLDVFLTIILIGSFLLITPYFLKFKSKIVSNFSIDWISIKFFLLAFFVDLTDKLLLYTD